MKKQFFAVRDRSRLKILVGLGTAAALAATFVLAASPGQKPNGVAANPSPHEDPSQPAAVPVVLGLGLEQQNTFALSLFAALAGKIPPARLDNAVFYPDGVIRLLRAVQAGSRGKTAEEIARALSLRDGPAPSGDPARPPTDGRAPVLRTADSLWSDPAYPFSPDYARAVREGTGAQTVSVPLLHDAGAAAGAINAWASEATSGHITNLLKPGDLRDARFVLTDVAWFKDSWQTAFAPERNIRAPFNLVDGKQRRVAYLADRRSARTASLEQGQALALPFATPRYECLCLLPATKLGEKPGEALHRLEIALSRPGCMTGFVEALAKPPGEVDIWLPKFDFNGYASNLIPALKALKIQAVFGNDADLSAMQQNKEGGLKVGVFKQEASFRLDESGAEASAATAAVVKEKSLAVDSTATFHADRPCLFFVRDTQTGVLVFMVRCAAPPETPDEGAATLRR